MPKTLYIIDGHAHIYAAYFAPMRQALTSPSGEPTKATYIFTMAVLGLIEKHKPDMLVVAMDTAAPTFRSELYPEYKAHRPPMTDDMPVQIDRIEHILEALRIPIEYLAGLFTAGDTAVVEGVLRRLAAMRSYMRDVNLGRETQPHIPESVGMTEEQIYEMYRLLALAKYDERYVIPTAYAAVEPWSLEEPGCSLSFEGGPGMYESGPFGEASGQPIPVAVETFHALRQRQTSEHMAADEARPSRVNLLNWDGRGAPSGLFPQDGDR